MLLPPLSTLSRASRTFQPFPPNYSTQSSPGSTRTSRSCCLINSHQPLTPKSSFSRNVAGKARRSANGKSPISPHAWVQLYSTYMLILSSKHPQALPELISYQLFMVKAAKKFRYPSWLYYDTEFRKWATTTTHCQEWSTINTQLYSLTFTGQGNSVSWCPICQVDGGNHTFDCPRYPIPTDPLPPQHPPSHPRPLLPSAPKRPRPPVEYCISYNASGGNCKYGLSCRYPHKCAVCGVHGHPETCCPNRSHQYSSCPYYYLLRFSLCLLLHYYAIASFCVPHYAYCFIIMPSYCFILRFSLGLLPSLLHYYAYCFIMLCYTYLCALDVLIPWG